MEKKILTLVITGMLLISPVFAKTDKTSQDYLQNKNTSQL